MPAIVLVGAQWGDEGKGKATDLLGSVRRLRREVQRRQQRRPHDRHRRREVRPAPAARRDPHARRRPGDRQRRRHRPRPCCSRRSTQLQARGVDTSRLLVSANAHVIPSYNRTLDKVTERFLGSRRIGTTGRGIGPTYADKMDRVGIRVQDLFDEKILRAEGHRRARAEEPAARQGLQPPGGRRRRGRRGAARVTPTGSRPLVADTGLLLDRALDEGRTVLLEGGQATLLDVDHGTYPFVTSSNATAGGACTGSGIPPTRDRPGHRDRQGVHDPGRRGPVPDRAARRRRRAAAQRPARSSAPRPAGRAAAAGSTRRSPATRPGSTASPTSCSPSSTCSPAWTRCRCASPTRSTASASTSCRSTRPTSTTRVPIYEMPPGLDRGHLQRARPRRPAAERARLRRLPRGAGRARRSRAIGVGPGRDETVVVRPLV